MDCFCWMFSEVMISMEDGMFVWNTNSIVIFSPHFSAADLIKYSFLLALVICRLKYAMCEEFSCGILHFAVSSYVLSCPRLM